MNAWPPSGLERFAESLPFEHLLRRRLHAEAMQRWRSESQATAGAAGPRVALLLEAGGDPAAEALTLASWALQTWPQTPWVAYARDAIACNRFAGLAGPPLAVVDDAGAGRLQQLGIDWVVPAVAGDVLHPSLAWTVARAAAAGAHLVGWDWLEAVAVGRGLVRPVRHRRGPVRDGVAELHADLRGRACAVRACDWHGGPREVHRARFSVPRAVDACLHPEPLGLYPPATASGLRPADAAAYWGTTFDHGPDGGLRPASAAPSVAVVILYRDRPALTCRAIRSVAAQVLPGRLELVLVDNASSPATQAEVDACLATVDTRIAVTRCAYPGPFNHSLQVQRALEASVSDVVVLLNNDAELLDADALDRLSRWAQVPGVASVGGQVVDERGECVGGGFHARAAPGPVFNSPVEEAAGPAGACPRESIGNSFACAAFGAGAFRALGGLDATWFPAGYNDVDYALRAVACGWTHVTLGDVRVRHAVGATRARQDEAPQKILLRQRHPWVATHALAQRTDTPVDLPPVGLDGHGVMVPGAGVAFA